MVLRVAFFMLMALALLGFGTVSWVYFAKPASTPVAAAVSAQPVTKPMLTASHAVRAGALLKPEDIGAKQVATNDPIVEDANVDTPEVRRSLVGAMVRRSLAAGDVVRNADIMRPGDHGFLAAVLQPGMRATTIAVDNTTGSAGLIWPGDRVDLILTETLTDATLPLGHRVAAETVLSDARVIAIDQQLIQGAVAAPESQAKTVTLEVTGEQAERVSVAVRLGRLSLSVRSADTPASPAIATGNGATTWAVDVSPALGFNKPPPPDSTVRVYQGGGDVKEFKY